MANIFQKVGSWIGKEALAALGIVNKADAVVDADAPEVEKLLEAKYALRGVLSCPIPDLQIQDDGRRLLLPFQNIARGCTVLPIVSTTILPGLILPVPLETVKAITCTLSILGLLAVPGTG